MLFLLAAGCPRPAPPAFFAPLPPPPEVAVPEFDAVPGDVAAASPLSAGEPAPGAGVLIPSVYAAECDDAYERADRWQDIADAEYAAHVVSRDVCNDEVGRLREGWRAAATDARWSRVAVPVAFVAGVGIGGAIVYGLAVAAVGVAP